MAIATDFKILIGSTSQGSDTYAGVEFGNAKESVMITEVSGMEIPPIRNNSGDWSGRDGGYMSSQLYSGRTITISGFYWDDSASCSIFKKGDYGRSVREKLVNSLTIRKLYPIFIGFVNGKNLYTEGYLTDFKMDYSNYKTGSYQVTFYCPDYALAIADVYGDASSIWRNAELLKESPGGHLVPEDLPVYFGPGSHASVVNYNGLIPGYPTVTIKGPATNPTIYNQNTGQQFMMGTIEDPFILNEGQTMTIDMENRQVTVGGKSRSMWINGESEWISLIPGKNKVYYTTFSEEDNNKASMLWRDLLQGA